jgi:hypothetical protein
MILFSIIWIEYVIEKYIIMKNHASLNFLYSQPINFSQSANLSYLLALPKTTTIIPP